MTSKTSKTYEGAVVKIMPNGSGGITGKLADAEVHFTSGPFAGLKLLGFAIWERRTGNGRNVTFPARTYSVNGERRSFSLLRAAHEPSSLDTARDFILGAYDDFQAQVRATENAAEARSSNAAAPTTSDTSTDPDTRKMHSRPDAPRALDLF